MSKMAALGSGSPSVRLCMDGLLKCGHASMLASMSARLASSPELSFPNFYLECDSALTRRREMYILTRTSRICNVVFLLPYGGRRSVCVGEKGGDVVLCK
jgi:hypothetical protein